MSFVIAWLWYLLAFLVGSAVAWGAAVLLAGRAKAGTNAAGDPGKDDAS